MTVELSYETLYDQMATKVKINVHVIKQVIKLINDGNTVPFIARYRKEMTGGLDEVKIKSIQDKWTYVVNLEARKEEVLRIIDEQGKLTDSLAAEIKEATQLQRVEDLYRPYKQKRRTRATIAKEKGLEPLAEMIWKQENSDVHIKAADYISEENELHNVDDVMAGANDIIA